MADTINFENPRLLQSIQLLYMYLLNRNDVGVLFPAQSPNYALALKASVNLRLAKVGPK